MSNSVNGGKNNNLEDHRENGVDVPGVGVPPQNPGNTPEPVPVNTISRDAQRVDISSHTDRSIRQGDQQEVQKNPTREECEVSLHIICEHVIFVLRDKHSKRNKNNSNWSCCTIFGFLRGISLVICDFVHFYFLSNKIQKMCVSCVVEP